MPRIDPLRLLSTLKPLLSPETGGIKSEKEVDKIFVLMTKYSKKLVSKCTYINIIEATPGDVRNVFMDRGGWDMLNSWTVEAKNTKNHVLLNEILNLLLTTPASVSRLRTNSLPKEVKQISNKWENEVTKSLAEKLVAYWIAIARSEEQGAQIQQQQEQQLQQQQQQHPVGSQAAGTVAAVSEHQQQQADFDMQDLGQLADEPVMSNVPLTDSTIYDSEVQPAMDLDNYINNVDLSDIMDFNPDLFTKAIDHFNELNTNDHDKLLMNNSEVGVITTMSTEQQHPQQHQQQQQQQLNQQQQQQQQQAQQLLPQQTIIEKMESNNTPAPTSGPPTVPPILIKKSSGGQCSVITADQVTGGDQQRFCVITHNGQKLLMRLHVADVSTAATAVVTPPTTTTAAAVTEKGTHDEQVAPTAAAAVAGAAEPSPPVNNNTAVPTKKRPRKDPSITALKNEKKSEVPPVSAPGAAAGEQPKILKTYSKKTNAELEKQAKASPTTSEKDKIISSSSKSKSDSSSSSKTKSSTSSSSSSSSGGGGGSSSSSSSSRRSSKTGSKSAAAADAEAERAEKLRLQVKEQKRRLKERAEEAKKEKKKSDEDKQKAKDDQTLKEIYGSVTPPTAAAVKIPKKKPSFTELIGVPGASEDTKKEKITKEKSAEDAKRKSEAAKDGGVPSTDEDSLQDATGLGPFTRPEAKDIGPTKERRPHSTVKVYTSAKSKNMDLLETMTKSSKTKVKLDADSKEAKPEKVAKNAMSFEDALLGAGAPIKPAKRPSVDSLKNGDSKKPKLEDPAHSKDGKKDSAAKKKEKKKEEKTSDGKKKQPHAIQESSLFMDAITATREPSKSRRKRRLSSSTDSSKDVPNGAVVAGSSKQQLGSPTTAEEPPQPVVKPVFNFYRDTLNDDDDDDEKPKEADTGAADETGADDVVMVDADDRTDEPAEVDDFAPAEDEGKLKSCLCIHRAKGKPKKGVRWREDEELKEYHYFEMDETERVNVTRQPKNFTEMKLMERSEEKLFVRRSRSGVKEPEEKFPWVPRLIDPSCLTGRPEVPVNSDEKATQEERERTILEAFYFPGPGTNLPDHPGEVDNILSDLDPGQMPRKIPADDVPVLTKLSDYSNQSWPGPKGVGVRGRPGNSHMPPASVGNNPPVTNPLDPASAFVNPFGAVVTPPQQPPAVPAVDFNNPWAQSFENIPPPPVNVNVNPDPWSVAAAEAVPTFPGFPAMPNPQVNAFSAAAAMSFGFPGFPPPAGPQMGNLPMGQMGPGNFAPFGGAGNVGPHQFDPTAQGQMGPDGNSGGPPPHRQQQGRPRDVDYRDMRRHEQRERDNRGGRDNRSGRGDRDRDRDRDNRESRDRRDRDYRDKDRDYRNHERRRPGGRRATLCNYFSKGYCREGNKCAFLHPGVNGPPLEGGSSGGGNGNYSRHKPSPPQSSGYHDRRRSPPSASGSSSNNRDSNHHQSSPVNSFSSSNSGPIPSGSRDNPIGIESPTPETETRFTPPSSPNENQNFAPVIPTEPVKVIPTFTEEDWG